MNSIAVLKQEAHRLLDLGHTPIPADPNKKHPPFSWGKYQDGGLTHRDLDRLFDQHPSANGLGILTEGLVIIDVDQLPDGSANPFPRNQDQRDELSRAPAVHTPGGGMHYYFSAPSGGTIKNSASTLAPNVDIRSSGGFLMLPPSARDGIAYRWQNDKPIDVPPSQLPVVPSFILDLLTKPSQDFKKGPMPLLGPVPSGQRNTTLFRLASKWRGQGHNLREILTLLQTQNDERCSPPLECEELMKIVHSVENYTPTDRKKIESLAVRTAAEFKKIQPPGFLIEQVIPEGVIVLFGPPGVCKSFLLLAVGSAVARGKPLFGNEDFQVLKTGCVIFGLPEGAASGAGRLRIFDTYHSYEDSSEMLFICEGINLFDKKGWELLEKTYQEILEQRGTPPALIIIDTLAAATPGANENTIEDMGLVMSRLQHFFSCGTNVLISHHSNKAGDYRGHSSIAGSCDALLYLVRDESSGTIELVSRKLRDAPDVAPCSFEIKSIDGGAVPVGSTTPGPWNRLEQACAENEGLADAFALHGFIAPGHSDQPTEESNFSKGFSPREIQSTWNKAHPPNDKKIRARRTRVLLKVMKDLLKSRVLELKSGSLNGNQADALNAEIVQREPPGFTGHPL